MFLTLAEAVTIVSSTKYGAHRPPYWHPERPTRTAILEHLPFKKVEIDDFHPSLDDALARVHDADYLADLAQPVAELRALDSDTFMSSGSWDVTRLATSAWLSAVDRVKPGETVFALTRPPGHHAGTYTACGFCTLNHCAAAAAYAQRRVAVLDIDVHFGNGCAAIFANEDIDVAYASIHQHPAWPNTGDIGDEINFGPYEERLKFVPMPPGTTGNEWLHELSSEALPFLEEHGPELVLISAGFDGLASDALAQFQLEPEDFYHAGKLVRSSFPDLPIVAGLEGGYDVSSLPKALTMFLNGLE